MELGDSDIEAVASGGKQNVLASHMEYPANDSVKQDLGQYFCFTLFGSYAGLNEISFAKLVC